MDNPLYFSFDEERRSPLSLESLFAPSLLFPPERKWESAKQIFGDVADIPEEVPLIIWGEKVVEAKRIEDCPECGWAGDIFAICPYHLDRQCPTCGGIPSTLDSCKCD